MALSHVVMECLQFLWKPLGLGARACPDPAAPLFWTRQDRVCLRRRARSEEGGISRDRVRERGGRETDSSATERPLSVFPEGRWEVYE